MSKISWLHLSDLHFREDVQHQWDENVVLKALLTDVREHVEKGELQPLFVVVSGDLAYSGKAGEYTLAGDFLDALLEATRLKKQCLFIVPGNHDVNLDNRTWGAKTMAAALTSRDAVREALTDEASRQLLLAKLRNYSDFVNGYLGTGPGAPDQPLWYVREISDDSGRKVGVLCLNSAWLANGGEGDRARLALGEYQVRDAVEMITGADLRIALMHHPFEWLADFDREVCEPLLMERCDFILRGHLHRTELLSLKSPDAEAMIIAAGAAYETRKHPNSYNWVQLDLDSGQGVVHLRGYSDRQVGFWTSDTSTYKNIKDGTYAFNLSRLGHARQEEVPAAPVIPARLSDGERRRHEANYLRYVHRTFNSVPLHIIDPRAAARTMRQTVELAKIYVGLNTTTMVSSRLKRHDSESGLKRVEGDGKLERSVSALEAADQEPAVVLLGDPGSGKSSFVDYLSLCLSGARLEVLGEPGESPDTGWLARLQPLWTRGALLPVVVTLRHFAKSDWCTKPGQNLWAFVVETMVEQGTRDFAPALHQQLDEGGVLVLLDGLDEVADPSRRQQVRDSVARFRNAHAHPANRWLVTCRGYAYQDASCRLDEFATYELASFDREQIDEFIGHWYEEVRRQGWKNQDEAEGLKERLQEAVVREDMAPLAANPLQLTMMAALQFSWGKLPEDRVDLYQWMVSLLLVRWQEGKLGHEEGITSLVSEATLVSVLERLAFVVHRDQVGGLGIADISEATLVSVLKDALDGNWGLASVVVDFMRDRAGILVDKGRSVYAFPHRSYQEYLAGSYLAVQPDFPDQATGLARENYAHWREAVLWAAAVMARRNKMIHVVVSLAEALCQKLHEGPLTVADWRCAVLAGEALLEAGVDVVLGHPVHRSTLLRVRTRLVNLVILGALEPLERAAAGRVLARLGDPRQGVGVNLRKTVDGAQVAVPNLIWCEVPAGPFTLGSPQHHSIPQDSESWREQSPRHQERSIVAPYFIGRYLVTNRQFRAFESDPHGYGDDIWWTEAGKQCRGRRSSARRLGVPYDLPNHPVVMVTWYEAVAYCNWLSEMLHVLDESLAVWSKRGLDSLVLPNAGWHVRLPSETEWEKAARGGDGRNWPWAGRFRSANCNSRETEIGSTTAVGLFPLGDSPYGCADMAGNVWEWCQTRWLPDYDGYASHERDRELAEGISPRVVRGGAFGSHWGRVHCAVRRRCDPDFYDRELGFRLALEACSSS